MAALVFLRLWTTTSSTILLFSTVR